MMMASLRKMWTNEQAHAHIQTLVARLELQYAWLFCFCRSLFLVDSRYLFGWIGPSSEG